MKIFITLLGKGPDMKKKYFVIHPAKFRLDGGAMFGIIPKPLWEKFAPPDALNRIDMSLRVMLIQTENKNILIDTGIGDYHGERWDERFDVRGTKNPLLAVLENEFNLKAEAITDLIISHLHFDHAGGLGQDQDTGHTVLFPKATVHLHREHYIYAMNPTERDSGSFQKEYFSPLIDWYESKNQVHWLEGEVGILFDDFKFMVSHGHTPYLLHAYDDKFIYMADLVPTSAHIKVPWVMGYDIAPGITVKDKRRFYHFIIEKKLTMIFEHDPKFWGANIAEEKKDFKAIELFSIDEKSALPILI
ncbi:MAG: MBL fold metallo-hydrolase [Bacteriovoracaceae bacterium]